MDLNKNSSPLPTKRIIKNRHLRKSSKIATENKKLNSICRIRRGKSKSYGKTKNAHKFIVNYFKLFLRRIKKKEKGKN